MGQAVLVWFTGRKGSWVTKVIGIWLRLVRDPYPHIHHVGILLPSHDIVLHLTHKGLESTEWIALQDLAVAAHGTGRQETRVLAEAMCLAYYQRSLSSVWEFVKYALTRRGTICTSLVYSIYRIPKPNSYPTAGELYECSQEDSVPKLQKQG